MSYAGFQMDEMRVLFFGLLGGFSLPPLQALLEAGITVVGVVVPTNNADEPLRELKPITAVSNLLLTPKQTNIVHLAWSHHIPVYEVSRLSASETRQTLAALHADVACVACFNKRIPPSLLKIPRYGFLNVHPSLLPQFRGPAPLFWTFRAGIQDTGVTVHLMDEGLDTGDIAQQAPLTLPTGISGQEADGLTGRLGGQLLVNTLTRLANGTFTPIAQPAGGSFQPWPQAADFRISVSWSARRAFNFMRGTAVFGQPYLLELAEGERVVQTAVSFYQGVQLSQPVVRQDNHIHIQFVDGVLVCPDVQLF